MAKYYVYETLEGDTFDSIALDFYNDEYKSSDIMNANPNYIKVLIFSANVKLKIPIIEEQPVSTLPPWKRG